uniref:Uncharacterized protein n=1 Tax=Arundo donax TaxID=35708 RepID=A0A0A9C9G5_ARUDO
MILFFICTFIYQDTVKWPTTKFSPERGIHLLHSTHLIPVNKNMRQIM